MPGSEQLRRGDGFSFGVMDMNLMRALVDWGERDAVAQFLERMGPKTNRTKEFLDWAALYDQCMAKRISRDLVRQVLAEIGSRGGKKSLETMTPEERSARAKKASTAAAKKRTTERLAREGTTKRAKKAG
jgi:hypothetical protein